MVPDETDESLASQAQKGDREAFLKLYNLYFRKVYNRVRSRVPSPYAEDVTQEVFIAVIRSLDTFERRSRFSTWLYTIVNRQIADFYRRRSRHHDDQQVELELVDHLVSEPVYLYERGDEGALIQVAMNELPDHYQEIILLRFADGLAFAEIAEQRGQTLEAVKSLYRRAIQALRDKMGVVQHES